MLSTNALNSSKSCSAMAKHDALLRRLAELERLASKRGGLDLSKLSVSQRTRYDAQMRADERTTYEQLLECDGPTLDADIARVLYGPNWRVNIEDDERRAADKYQLFRERYL